MTAKWKNLPYFSTQKCKNIYRQKIRQQKVYCKPKHHTTHWAWGVGGSFNCLAISFSVAENWWVKDIQIYSIYIGIYHTP